MSTKIIAMTRTDSTEVLYLHNIIKSESTPDEMAEVQWRQDRNKAWHLEPAQALALQIEILQIIADRQDYLARPQWLELAESVSVIDAVQKKLYFVNLKAIVFEPTAKATREFEERVRQWMKSWTVENNFQPILTADIDNQLRMYAVKLERDFKSAIGAEVTPAGTNLLEHFRLEYTKSPVQPDVHFYLNNGTWTAKASSLFDDAMPLHGKKVNHG